MMNVKCYTTAAIMKHRIGSDQILVKTYIQFITLGHKTEEDLLKIKIYKCSTELILHHSNK